MRWIDKCWINFFLVISESCCMLVAINYYEVEKWNLKWSKSAERCPRRVIRLLKFSINFNLGLLRRWMIVYFVLNLSQFNWPTITPTTIYIYTGALYILMEPSLGILKGDVAANYCSNWNWTAKCCNCCLIDSK